MRLDSPEFQSFNEGESREPRFVVELSFDDANLDIYYLTSHSIAGLAGNILSDTLKMVSSTSQSISPEKANSTIGSIKFECLDAGLTALQRQKLGENKGLTGKRVRVYQGFKGLDWSDYSLIQTQVISSTVSYKDGVYRFQCADIQRAMRKDIFSAKETALRASLSDDATTLPVYSTTGFESVYQVPSTEGKTVLRGLQQQGLVSNAIDDVGFLKIEGGSDQVEIAMWTSKTTDEFTVVRGVLGTKPINVEVGQGDTRDNAPKITEYIYLEMAAIKCAYALLTGSLYGHAGKFLPDHWHLGISTDYVNTSSFVGIGEDLWNTADDDKGYPAVIRGTKKESGKTYIEKNLFYMTGVYTTIQQTGELKLKRIGDLGAAGSYSRELNETNVVKYGSLTHDLKAVVNRFIIKWNYDDRKEATTRVSVFIDPSSIERHKESDFKTISMPTLSGSRHSYSIIKYHFDTVRTLTSAPPLKISLDLMPSQNDLEVGDIVRASLDNIKDLTSDEDSLNRNFQVRSVSNNWKTGGVKVSLFGSSEKVVDIPPETTEPTGASIADFGAIFAAGTEINAANFGAAVSSSGGVTTINSDITLSGNYALANPSSIFYCLEDLTVNAGATISIDNNVIILSLGFLQLNGKIDGEARGFAGGALYSSHGVPEDLQHYGSAGIGNTSPQGGIKYYIQSGFADSVYIRPAGISRADASGNPISLSIDGVFNNTPRPLLSFDDDGLSGLPETLMGSSGSCSVGVWDISGSSRIRATGAAGGAGGAGLCIMSAGMAFGAAAEINLSGEDGTAGGSYNPLGLNVRLHAGASAGGHAGGLLYVNLDSQQNTPSINEEHVTLELGVCPVQAPLQRSWTSKLALSSASYSSYYGGRLYGARENTVQQNSHVLFLDTSGTPVEDVPSYVETSPAFTLTEQVNTPVTPNGDRSTIEVSVTPPAGDPNYSYSEVDYRRSDKTAWISALPASNESLIEVPSAGATFEIRVRPVSISGLATPSGEIKSITVIDRNGRTNAELAAIYPFPVITSLSLKNNPSATFTGMGPLFQWDNNCAETAYFNYYEVLIYSGATYLRTERSVSPLYEYTYEKNREDYTRINATGGIYNDIEIRVSAISKYRNNVNELYGGAVVTFAVSSTNVFERENLRFYRAFEQQIIDDIASAGGGGDLTTFYTATEPTTATTGDLWFDTGNGNAISRYNGTAWEDAQDSAIAAAVNAAQSAQTTADGKAVVFYSDTTPFGADVGDLWFSELTNQIQRFSGTIWELVGDVTDYTDNRISNSELTQAIADAAAAGATVQQIADIQDAADAGATAAQIQAIIDAQQAADNAQNSPQVGSNLLYNGDMSLVGADGAPAGLLATNNDSHVISYFDAEKTIAAISGTDSGPVGLPAFRVIEGTTYRLFVRARTTIAKASGFYIRVREFNGELAQGFTHVGGSAVSSPIAGYDSQSQWTSGPDFENIGLGTTWEDFEVEYTPPAGVTWATLSVWKNWGANDALLIDRMEAASLADQTNYDDDRVNNNNATGFTLVPTSDMRVTGARVECLSGGAWDNSVRSVEGFTGGAFLSFRVPQTNKRIMFGLDTNPTEDDDYQNIDALFYLRNDGTYQARVNGALVYGSVAYVAGDIFSITYDNVNVRWYVNGALVWTHAVTDGLTLYIDSSFLDGNAVIESIQFGPYQSNNWNDVAGDNRPADNADVTDYNDERIANSVIDKSGWVNGGTMPPAGWLLKGSSNENSFLTRSGPSEDSVIAWRASEQNDSSVADGGFSSNIFNVNPNRPARFAMWVNRTSTSGNTVASITTETGANLIDNLLFTTDNESKFFEGDLPATNKWYLFVGYILRAFESTFQYTAKSGFYDPLTGERAWGAADFKFGADTSQIRLNGYLDQATTGVHDFIAPRWDVLDGTEPSIQELLRDDNPLTVNHISDAGTLARADNIDWDADILNIPDEITGTATTGLNLTPTYMGHFDGTKFTSYIDSNGNVFFGDANNHYFSWDVNAGILQVRGEIQAEDVVAGGTLTGSTIQTAATGERAVIDAADNTISFYWDSGDATIRKNIHLGGSTAADSNFYALVIGGPNYEDRGAYIRTKSSPAIVTHSQEVPAIFASSGDQPSISGGASSDASFHSRTRIGLSRCAATWPCVIAKTHNIGNFELVKIIGVLTDYNYNWCFEVAPVTATNDVTALGVVALTKTFTIDEMGANGWYYPDLVSDVHQTHGSTHDYCLVYVPGSIVPAKVGNQGGSVAAGDRLSSRNTTGCLSKTTSAGNAYVIGKALVATTVTEEIVPILIRGS
jgi:hypothetical protein